MGRSNAVFFTRTHHLTSCLFPSCSLSPTPKSWAKLEGRKTIWPISGVRFLSNPKKLSARLFPRHQQISSRATKSSTRSSLPKGLDALQILSDRHHHVINANSPGARDQKSCYIGYLFCLTPPLIYLHTRLETGTAAQFYFPSRCFGRFGD